MRRPPQSHVEWDGAEPWPFFEGVNSLPTLVLCLTTLGYAYAAVVVAAARMAQVKRAFQEEWDLPSDPLPCIRHPIVRSLLLPSLAYGVLVLLESPI